MDYRNKRKYQGKNCAFIVAEAAKEGRFLGIGGVAVSEAEKATLTEISTALKLPA